MLLEAPGQTDLEVLRCCLQQKKKKKKLRVRNLIQSLCSVLRLVPILPHTPLLSLPVPLLHAAVTSTSHFLISPAPL